MKETSSQYGTSKPEECGCGSAPEGVAGEAAVSFGLAAGEPFAHPDVCDVALPSGMLSAEGAAAIGVCVKSGKV